ncbi:MAG: hypothetical protein M3P51_11735 [Chloroflexota bacterium]|nr:hypothetical protein [Chloroflexota bacterium]
MKRGLPWHKAVEAADTRLGRATAFRALRIVRLQGEGALDDGRHGHPHKLTAPVREWLVEYCRGAPKTPSRVVQTEIEQQFGITVGVSQVNRVRTVLGVSSRFRCSGGK